MNQPAETNGQPQGQLELRDKRHGLQVRSVSFPERTVEAIVMPYEQETIVDHKGRMVTEVISKGAFNGIQRRKILANRDHDVTRVVGQCVALHPNDPDGLVAEIQISNTDLGTDTLILANDGVLDMSAGFMPMKDGETWESRDRRRITKAWLGHVAFVPEPAYEGARVLAVRAAPPESPGGIVVATPNLDRIRVLRLQDEYDSLSR